MSSQIFSHWARSELFFDLETQPLFRKFSSNTNLATAPITHAAAGNKNAPARGAFRQLNRPSGKKS
jgi:hypothetical protein